MRWLKMCFKTFFVVCRGRRHDVPRRWCVLLFDSRSAVRTFAVRTPRSRPSRGRTLRRICKFKKTAKPKGHKRQRNCAQTKRIFVGDGVTTSRAGGASCYLVAAAQCELLRCVPHGADPPGAAPYAGYANLKKQQSQKGIKSRGTAHKPNGYL